MLPKNFARGAQFQQGHPRIRATAQLHDEKGIVLAVKKNRAGLVPAWRPLMAKSPLFPAAFVIAKQNRIRPAEALLPTGARDIYRMITRHGGARRHIEALRITLIGGAPQQIAVAAVPEGSNGAALMPRLPHCSRHGDPIAPIHVGDGLSVGRVKPLVKAPGTDADLRLGGNAHDHACKQEYNPIHLSPKSL